MGQPSDVRTLVLSAGGEEVTVSAFSIGNPQCVVLGALPSDERFERVGPALERHPAFPHGTNVEFAAVEGPERVRIRIWERGVGPTASSGSAAPSLTTTTADGLWPARGEPGLAGQARLSPKGETRT